jgi:acyl carrier protein
MKQLGQEEIKAAIITELAEIAPEADLTKLAAESDFRKALEIDSFDFLRLLIALNRRLGVEFPEADYGRLVNLKGLVAYIEASEKAAGELS